MTGANMTEYKEENLPAGIRRLVVGSGVEGRYIYFDPDTPRSAPARDNSIFLLHTAPEKDTGKKTLLFFPGPPGNHHTLLYFTRLGALHGHNVFVPDLSGLGLSARRSGAAASFDNYASTDIPAIINLLSEICGETIYIGGVCGGAGGALMTVSYLARRCLDGDASASAILSKLEGLITLSMPFDFTQERAFLLTWDMITLLYPHTRNKYFFKWLGRAEQLIKKSDGDPLLYEYIKNKNMNGYSNVPKSIIDIYGKYFKTGRLNIKGIDCTRQIGAVASESGMPVLSVSGNGDELYTYNALRGFPRKLRTHRYPDYVYVVIRDLGHLPLLGSKCEMLWDHILGPWLEKRPTGEKRLDRLLRTSPETIADHSDCYFFQS